MIRVARITGASAARRVITLSEWQRRDLRRSWITAGDRVLLDQLAGEADRRVEIEVMRDRVRIRTRSWVGVIRLERIEIRIEPKLAGDALDLVRMLEYVSGVEGLWRARPQRSLDTGDGGLLELIALLFAEAAGEVVRRGLLSGYVQQEDEIPYVRGRILADRQMLRRHGRLDRIHCRFDELEQDILENRLIAAAIHVAQGVVTGESLRRKLARLRLVFDSVCDPSSLDLGQVGGGLVYDRLNSYYEPAHILALLLLHGLGVQDLLKSGRSRSFVFLLDMNALFEKFVFKILEHALAGGPYRLQYQVSVDSIIRYAANGKPYMRIRPDVLLEDRESGARLPIDAKYKRYDESRLQPGDVYQVFLYAYALGRQSEGRMLEGMVIYPTQGRAVTVEALKVQGHGGGGARLSVVGLPVAGLLGEVCGSGGDRSLRDQMVRAVVGSLRVSTEVMHA